MKQKNTKLNKNYIYLPKYYNGTDIDFSSYGGQPTDSRSNALEFKKEKAYRNSGDKGKKVGVGIAAALANVGGMIPGVGTQIEDSWNNSKLANDPRYEKAAKWGAFAGNVVETVGTGFTNPAALGDSVTETLGSGLEAGAVTTVNEKARPKLMKAGKTFDGLSEQIGSIGGSIGGSANAGKGMLPTDGKFAGTREGYSDFSNQINGFLSGQGGGQSSGLGGMDFSQIQNMFQFKNGGDIKEIGGNTHENGGTPLDINGDGVAEIEAEVNETTDGQFIFSNRLKPQGSKKSFADISKTIENKYKNSDDKLSSKTKDFELELLKEENRKMKSLKEMGNIKNTKLPKAADGFDLGNGVSITGTQPIPMDMFPYGMTIPTDDGNIYGKLPNQSPYMAFMTEPKFLGNNQNMQNKTFDNITPNTRSFDSVKKTSTNPNSISSNKGEITSGDKWQMAGSAISPITNAGLLISDIAQKPEKVKRIYDQSPITKMQISDEEGLKNIREQFSSTKEALQSGARNFNVIANNLQSGMAKTQENIGKYKNEVAGKNKELEINKEARVQEQRRGNINLFNQYETADAQNRAARKDAIRQDVQYLAETSAQGVKNVGDVKNQTLTNQIQYETLDSYTKNFKMNPSYKELINKGWNEQEMFAFRLVNGKDPLPTDKKVSLGTSTKTK